MLIGCKTRMLTDVSVHIVLAYATITLTLMQSSSR